MALYPGTIEYGESF